MAMSKEDNDLMTRVSNGAPLGEMLRQHYWIPAVPSRTLEADGAPLRVRLLGTDYVAFRATDGRVGFMDELCPHRKASLALGRNEQQGLRCIYHGWKFGTDGAAIEVPNVEGDQTRFCKSVKTSRYRVEERGGIIWVWLGKGDTAPKFPNLPFTDLPEEQRSVTSQMVPTNWLQGVEASMDTTHVSFLHSSTTEMSGSTQRRNMIVTRAARLEFEDRPYGFRYAAIRTLPDERQYARVNNFVMPWYGVVCAPEADGPSTVFFSVPVDDENHRAWFVHFNPTRRLGATALSMSPDVYNWPPLPPGPPEANWGQNRDIMQRGHFSGFPQHLATEDFAMFMSQGRIHDRTDEQLCSADAALVRVRQQILKSVREFMAGQTPKLADSPELDYAQAVSVGAVLTEGQTWKSLVA
ncbi:MAG TPA: Rieske 2Fe-2S domain-containing protein [Azospirillum sp.]|nr:Rieske 2Fe-2S domain-containing protein [Azospirillum sp.]